MCKEGVSACLEVDTPGWRKMRKLLIVLWFLFFCFSFYYSRDISEPLLDEYFSGVATKFLAFLVSTLLASIAMAGLLYNIAAFRREKEK